MAGYLTFTAEGNPGDEVTLALIKRELDLQCIPYLTLPHRRKASPYRKLTQLTEYLKDSSSVLFCGGNLLQNETSNRSLAYYLYVIGSAKAHGIPVLFVSSGIGSIRGKIAGLFTKMSLSDTCFFGARTFFDYNQLQYSRIKQKIYMPDLCFTLPTTRAKKRDIFAYIPKTKNPEAEYALRNISSSLGISPIVIPLHHSYDYKACTRASKRLGAPIVTVGSYRELTEFLSKCRFTVSERLHGGIFSLLSHTPTFLLDSSLKCRALTDDIRYLCACLGIKPPIFYLSSLSLQKVKELGAQDSEFDIILNNLKLTAHSGLKRLCMLLKSNL